MTNRIALFAVLFALFVALGSRHRNTPYLIDPTPASSAACVKAPPVCDANCVRLMVGRGLA